MHEYKTASSVCGFVEFCAWAGVVVAILIALMAIAAGSSRGGSVALVALVPAFSLALASFIVIVMVQMARASMDNSVTSQKMLKQSETQHREMLSVMRTYGARSSSVASMQKSSDVTAPMEREKAHDSEALSMNGGRTSMSVNADQHILPNTDFSEYRGIRIEQIGYKLVVEGRRFSSLDSAQAYINQLLDGEPVSNRIEPTLSPPRGLG